MQNVYNRHPYQSDLIGGRKQHSRASSRALPTCTDEERKAAELRQMEQRVRRERLANKA